MSADNRHIKTEHQSFDDFNEAPDVFNIKKENRESFGADSSNTSEQAGTDCPKFIRLRGLPWSATHKEILDFLKGVNVLNGSKGIHLITGRWDGKNTGEAYVEVESLQDVEEARKLNKASMGHRYIEVFTTNPKEAKEAMRKTGGHGGAYVVKLRGLPFAVTAQQIEEFFNGLEIKPDREGILFVMDRRGRATGEAFVQFETQEDTEQALGRNREKIGHRYIEIFRSSMAELKRAANGNGRPGPYDIRERGSNRGGGGGGFNEFPNAGRGNNMRDGWNGQSGANNTLGFNNMPNFTNSGNFGNSFSQNNSNRPNSTGPFPDNNNMGFGNNGHFGNNSNFGNFRQGCNNNNNNNNNSNNNGPNNQEGRGSFANFNTSLNNNNTNMSGKGNNNMNNFSGNNRFNNGNNNDNFGNNFGDFNNFGNQRNFMGNNFGGNNMHNNDFPGNRGPGNNHYNNFGNDGPNHGNFNNGPPAMGGNFGPVGGGRGDCELFTIHMRGLPYSSFENDVFKFFDPIRPVNVRINFNKKGLHSGTADAFFDTYEDAQLAMKRHREQMGSRYIELFFDGKTKGSNNSIPYPNNNMGGNNGGNFSRRI